jgi:ubiquinone biosynthesis protein
LVEEVKNEPQKTNHPSRYLQIARVLAKYRLEEVLDYVGLKYFKLITWFLRGNPFRRMTTPRPVRMRMAIEELGTTFVKLGQILSTRTDLIPPEYTKQLSKLQNSLVPLPVDVMKKVLNERLGNTVEKLFVDFNPSPIGVASIGQVYACTLLDGTQAVVKIQKPGVPQLVDADFRILAKAAVSATRYWPDGQYYDLVGIVQELNETIKGEMDYLQEGHSAEYFAWFFREDKNVHIPKIFWKYTDIGVITMERINGIGILNVEAIDKAGFDRKDLAHRAVSLWLKMVFEGEAFHADPHPGNLFVEPDGKLGLLDFGMVYIVDDEVRWHLANVVKSILDRNVDTLIDALIELGAVNLRIPGSRAKLRKDLKHVMGHFSTTHLQKTSENVSYNLSLLFTVLRSNHIQLPSNTFLLLKTIVMAQSIGRGLDPDFDIVPLLEKYVLDIYKKKYSILRALRRLPSATTELASLAGQLPQRLDRMLKTFERGEIQITSDVSGVEKHLHHLELLVDRALLGMIAAALILGLALFFVALRSG